MSMKVSPTAKMSTVSAIAGLRATAGSALRMGHSAQNARGSANELRTSSYAVGGANLNERRVLNMKAGAMRSQTRK